MRQKRLVIIPIIILLSIVFSLVSYYTHDNDDLPAGMILINDIYAGYKLAIPQSWYEIPASATNKEIIGFFLDANKFHHIRKARLPINLNILKQGGEFRIFFIDFNEETISGDFISMGTIMVVREAKTDDLEFVKSKIENLKIEINKLQSIDKNSLNKNVVFHVAVGNSNTKEGMAYLIVTYFKADIGLVIIPIISPLNQHSQTQLTMDEIIKSIEIFEPKEIPNSGE